MAGFQCLAATGKSLERLINACFAEQSPIPDGDATVRAVLIRTDDLEQIGGSGNVITPPALSIFFYRVDFNKAMRAGWSAVGSLNGRAYLPLDLHFMITPWASNAEHELQILGRAMQCLEEHPSLTGPLLSEDGGWAAGGSVQVVMEEVPTEAVMRTFDSLPHDYKLSVPYVARVVRLDSLHTAPPTEAVTVIAGLTPAPAP